MESTYQKQAENFLKETGTAFKVEFLKHGKHWEDDKDTRDIYKITLTRGNRSFSFDFGQSIIASGKYVVVYNMGKHEQGEKLHDEAELKKVKRDFLGSGIYRFWRENKSFSEPSAYEVLACLQKYDVGTFEDFCEEFGYDTDSRKAEKIYQAVLNEYTQLKTLYNDKELELMAEIQ